MSVEPTAPTSTDQATSTPAPLAPSGHVLAAPVTAGEITEFLRHLTELHTSSRGDDPAARAAFLQRKAELFARLATDQTLSATPPAPGRGTP